MANLRRAHSEIEGGLIQRCVIVHRDETGYGLTVSGDNPVYVQSIKEYGAASKAGVHVGDRIIKVNGTLVTKSNHIEVVKLIKGGSYVALTLLGRPPNERTKFSASFSEKSSTFPVLQESETSKIPTNDSSKNERIIELQRMLEQEHMFCDKSLEEYMHAPSSRSQKELAESQTRIKALENQIKALTGVLPSKQIPPAVPTRSIFKSNSSGSFRHSPSSRSHSTSSLRSYSLRHSRTSSKTEYQPVFDPSQEIIPPSNGSIKKPFSDINSNNNQKGEEEIETATEVPVDVIPMTSIVAQHTRQSSDSDTFSPQSKRMISDDHRVPINGLQGEVNANEEEILSQPTKMDQLQATSLHPAISVISMEDEEFESDNEKIDDHGPFLDLEILRHKPAHLSVFLHFVMSNSDPSALFFWLVTDTYTQEQGSVKELKKWSYEIYSTFLVLTAPLRVCIPEEMEQAIDENLSSKTISEEAMRNIFVQPRSVAFQCINDQLADFRNKRALGLGSLFGDHQLQDDLDRQSELKIVEQTLLPHLVALTAADESKSKEGAQQDRNSAMASALATFMKQVGVTIKTVGNPLERCKSFAEKERNSLFKFKSGKKAHSIKGHQFVNMQYTSMTLCNHCEGLLWGIGTQGYQCTACEMNIHRGSCAESLEEACGGSKAKRKKNDRLERQANLRKKHLSPKASASHDEATPDVDIPIEGRSRGNSLLEEADHQNANATDKDPFQNEEQSLSESETEKAERPLSGSPIEELLQARINRPIDALRKSLQHNNKFGRSESVKTQKDVFSRIAEKKKSAPPLPGFRLRNDLSIAADNGVYAPNPYNPNRGESPPSLSDDEQEPDSDLEVETEVPNWSQIVDKKVVKRLKNKELKRQEVIHELIHTEKTHVRNLKVLDRVFLRPMRRKQIMSPDAIQLLFPNLDELIEIHKSLLAAFKARSSAADVVQNIGDIMLDRFDGPAGEKLRESSAMFCNDQKQALEMLKNQQKKDIKLAQFMILQEGSPHCRRLKFQDILASTHQRLTKYPMLLEGILKATPVSHVDYNATETCVKCCKETLNYVNQSIKECENQQRLVELSRKIIKRPLDATIVPIDVKTLDITKRKLIYEGTLQWRISRSKPVDLHVVLLEDILVLLVRQDDRFILKCHSTTTGAQDVKTTHSPLILLTNLLIRNVATDKKAFFMVSTSMVGPQIYELVAQTTTERKLWVKAITETAEAMKGRERGRRGGLCLATSKIIPLVEEGDEKEESDQEIASPLPNLDDIGSTRSEEEDSHITDNRPTFEQLTNETSVDDSGASSPRIKQISLPTTQRRDQIHKLLQEKDEMIAKALEEKSALVAELKGYEASPMILPEDTSEDANMESRERVLAAILQANRLTLAVSEIVHPHNHDMDHDDHLSRQNSEDTNQTNPSVIDIESLRKPCDTLLEAATALNEQLTLLLSTIAERDNTHERLHSELQSVKANLQRVLQVNGRSASSKPASLDLTHTPAFDIIDEDDMPTPTNSSVVLNSGHSKHDDSIEDEEEDTTVISISDLHSIHNTQPSVFLANPFKKPRPKSSGDRSEDVDSPDSTIARTPSFPGYPAKSDIDGS